jgi:hypothetical protein
MPHPLPPLADINPYASPAGVGGYEPDFNRGVGTWRDGDRLVIHKDAELPRVCLITGEPAHVGFPLEVFGGKAFPPAACGCWRR